MPNSILCHTCVVPAGQRVFTLADDMRARQLLEQQLSMLNDDKIVLAESRKGFRRKTGVLLEDAFVDIATRLTPDLSIEIGAHEASFSQRLKRSLPHVCALAFEANPFVYDKYVDRLSPEIEYRHAAISDQDGEIDLYVPISLLGRPFGRDNAISSVSSRSHEGFEYETVRVPARTLDTLLTDVNIGRSVAWVDAEGAQRQIIAGGRDYFSRVLAVYIEVERQEVWKDQPLAMSVVETLASFELEQVMVDNLARVQYNAVFVRSTAALLEHARSVALDYLRELRTLVGSVTD